MGKTVFLLMIYPDQYVVLALKEEAVLYMISSSCSFLKVHEKKEKP